MTKRRQGWLVFAVKLKSSDARFNSRCKVICVGCSEGGAAQEEVVTVRGERFVIPVKAEHKRRVQGVVHGASSSGQTVFVEPLETIEQNNELVRLLEDELAEVHRILLEMTRRLAKVQTKIHTAARYPGGTRTAVCQGKIRRRLQLRSSDIQPRHLRVRYGATGALARPTTRGCPILISRVLERQGGDVDSPVGSPTLILRDARHPYSKKFEVKGPTLCKEARRMGTLSSVWFPSPSSLKVIAAN